MLLAPERPGRIHVTFDDRRLVANARLLLPITLVQRLGGMNWWTITLIWEMRQVERTLVTRC